MYKTPLRGEGGLLAAHGLTRATYAPPLVNYLIYIRTLKNAVPMKLRLNTHKRADSNYCKKTFMVTKNKCFHFV